MTEHGHLTKKWLNRFDCWLAHQETPHLTDLVPFMFTTSILDTTKVASVHVVVCVLTGSTVSYIWSSRWWNGAPLKKLSGTDLIFLIWLIFQSLFKTWGKWWLCSLRTTETTQEVKSLTSKNDWCQSPHWRIYSFFSEERHTDWSTEKM